MKGGTEGCVKGGIEGRVKRGTHESKENPRDELEKSETMSNCQVKAEANLSQSEPKKN